MRNLRSRDPLSRWRQVCYGALGVLVVLAVMQLAVGTGIIASTSVPTATSMVDATGRLAVDRSFLSALGDTLAATVYVFLIAGAAGVVVGLLLGASDRMWHALRGVIDFLRPIPSVALLPVAILLFGIGTEMKLVLAGYAAFWPVLINTVYGVRDTDRVMLATARSFRWSRSQLMRRVMLPAALPFIATGLRLASAVSLVVVITTELLAAEHGVGTVIRAYQTASRPQYVYAGILVIAVVGWLLNLVVSLAEARLVHWAPERRGR